ncbi:NAD(P)H-dependent oxidoreductase subunit E [Desulfofundulus thermobenzoicus]|uniref:NAD(P)H-dependent oxidoreductase subunit E n=1 Tax=Desulfofundulus thermobenzoicus TaxID=29376 RepID=A0A6N7ILW5_9FIRM|nr:NAD(P)H-dependent oxidoreductase subunit E [Desulfofundulus thermobenzoicus]MQL50970.1 NAD(P)H-dependent oxidoreductase subunit E [Desulfofundulus thermobenzoicus]HHW42860.1 NAD(P)H-dependent oxidoreductase subunit E [Desulfotomaculum sp.]
MESTDRKFAKLQEIIHRHGGQVSHLIAILQEVQQEYRYLPEEVMTFIATALNVPPAVVYGVATFYAQFSLAPKGKYVIRVCNGTACHVRGAEPIHFALRRALGLAEGQETTEDLQFTVETVSCLGACGLAPVVTINDREIFGQLTPEDTVRVLQALQTWESRGEGGSASA